jgi:hypothetical protein
LGSLESSIHQPRGHHRVEVCPVAVFPGTFRPFDILCAMLPQPLDYPLRVTGIRDTHRQHHPGWPRMLGSFRSLASFRQTSCCARQRTDIAAHRSRDSADRRPANQRSNRASRRTSWDCTRSGAFGRTLITRARSIPVGIMGTRLIVKEYAYIILAYNIG